MWRKRLLQQTPEKTKHKAAKTATNQAKKGNKCKRNQQKNTHESSKQSRNNPLLPFSSNGLRTRSHFFQTGQENEFHPVGVFV